MSTEVPPLYDDAFPEHSYDHFNMETDWMGVDFDGTVHDRTKTKVQGELGPPVPLMVARIKAWRAKGMQVRLLTARVSEHPMKEIPVNNVPEFQEHQRKILSAWCLKHIGEVLPITDRKDGYMYQLWDDRSVCVERNTGKILGMNKEW